MFCSSSITIHLLRGAGAAILLLAAGLIDFAPALLRIAAVAGALLLMRGCPMCWLMGLMETVQARRPGVKPAPASPPAMEKPSA